MNKQITVIKSKLISFWEAFNSWGWNFWKKFFDKRKNYNEECNLKIIIFNKMIFLIQFHYESTVTQKRKRHVYQYHNKHIFIDCHITTQLNISIKSLQYLHGWYFLYVFYEWSQWTSNKKMAKNNNQWLWKTKKYV